MAILPSFLCRTINVYLFGAEERGGLTQGVRTSWAQMPLKELPRRSGGPRASLHPSLAQGACTGCAPGEGCAPRAACSASSGPVEPAVFALQGALVISRLLRASQLLRCDIQHGCSELSCWARPSDCALARAGVLCCGAAAVVRDDCPRAAANAATENVTAGARDNLGVSRLDL